MFRTRKIALFVVVLLVVVAFFGCRKRAPEGEGSDATAGSSTFEAGFKVAAGGKAIDVEVGHLVPDAVDWNNDGKKDLLVGQFKDGGIHLYLNEGTDSKPVFGDFTLLAAGDKPIQLDAG